ncbi:MAG: hypothetical protein U0599_14435 [Vicinamibacteria bacterium]
MHEPRGRRARALRRAAFAALAFTAAAGAGAQTIDDGLMMPRRQFCTGFVYAHDAWDRYWEGTLERGNGNVGTLTTQSVSWMGTYGVTDRLNVIAMLPWVTTGASRGVMSGLSGLQDATVAVKWTALQAPLTSRGTLRAFAVASAGAPVSDYTPDFLPMSIGLHSRRAAARATLNWESEPGLFVEGTGSYTWRGNVTLNRDAYYDGEHLVMSNEVAMPDVIDYTFRVGYWKHGLYVPVSFTQQITAGGYDIRRQDAPFVSNRMNFSRVDVVAAYYLKSPRFVFRAGVSRIVSGRNVGKSTAVQAGILYTFHF